MITVTRPDGSKEAGFKAVKWRNVQFFTAGINRGEWKEAGKAVAVELSLNPAPTVWLRVGC